MNIRRYRAGALRFGQISRVLAFLIVLLGAWPTTTFAGDIVALVRRQHVPPEGYQSWAVFLMCTPDWLMPERSADLVNLYRRFEAFGDSIGEHNAAVWFWKETMPLGSARLAQNVDTARSAEYCRALELRPSEGPFLVVTLEYPDLTDFPKDRAVFSLGRLPPRQLAQLLNRLTDELLIDGTVAELRDPPSRATSSSPATVPPGFWIRLLEGTRRAMTNVGCATSLKVDAGFLSAEVKGCPQ
jgi:hypothetical protein